MKQIENLFHIAANSNISVLLQGESGSGKEVAARFIHSHSKRSNGPFIALNCGAIAHNLAESILEGSRKGAFTGAVGDQLGVVRAANGGTLFLDEIGEMPLDAQCKLLRILQERSVMPLGATTNIPVDFRLICATNRNLRQEVANGRFREDLYFRLNVFPIKVPALRERTDFASLAQDLWREAVYSLQEGGYVGAAAGPSIAGNSNRPNAGRNVASVSIGLAACVTLTPPLSPQEIALLGQKNWPGNVRQLKNVLQRFALLRPYGVTLGEILRDEFSPLDFETATPAHFKTSIPAEKAPPHPCSKKFFEKLEPARLKDASRVYNATPHWETILAELHKNNWNKSVTAQSLGISRGSLAYQIRKHDLERDRTYS